MCPAPDPDDDPLLHSARESSNEYPDHPG
jgi:hypothetical protein